ncbi:MAG: hypothetical protein WC514_03300 [Candidatus Paceibacterota bacterium]
MSDKSKLRENSFIEKLLKSAEKKKGIEKIQCLLRIIFLCLFDTVQLKRQMDGSSVFCESEDQYQDRLAKISAVVLFFESVLRKNNEVIRKKKSVKKINPSRFLSFLRFFLRSASEKTQNKKEGERKKMDNDALDFFNLDGVLFEITKKISERGINPSHFRSLLFLGWKEAASDILPSLIREEKSKSSKLVLRPIARQVSSFLERASSTEEEIGTTKDYLRSFLN